MDWSEALEDVVEGFSNTEKTLRTFVAKHGPVLSDQNSKDIASCIAIASSVKFADMPGGDMKNAGAAAEKFLETLKKIERRVVRELKA